VAVVAFFIALRYSIAPQEEEEGDGSYCRLLRCAAAQHNKTRGRRRQ